VADCLARDSYMLTQHSRDEVTAELLGIDKTAVHKAVSDLSEGSDNRALVIALALVLGALEARTPKDAWRYGAGAGYGLSVRPVDYLAFLVANGYQLAEVERVIVGDKTSEGVYLDYCR
jgi:ParB family chromosome partitioning protein